MLSDRQGNADEDKDITSSFCVSPVVRPSMQPRKKHRNNKYPTRSRVLVMVLGVSLVPAKPLYRAVITAQTAFDLFNADAERPQLSSQLLLL